MGQPEPLDAVEEERGLVERMRAGDERAFERFCDAYVAGLYRFAARRLRGDQELTRDIVQSTVCKVIQNLEGYRGEAPLFTWLCACCRNEIAAHFRRRDRRPREVAMDDGVEAAGSPGPPGPEQEALRLESAELVHAALDRLPESYGRALEWRYLEDLDVPEIARRLDTTYKATESLLSRARRAFRAAHDQLAMAGAASGPAPRNQKAVGS
jgi:RNA polymerase sigma-70 factor (ECF subfamily)